MTVSQTHVSNTTAAAVGGRLRAEGKALVDDGGKVFLRGVSYGPFQPNSREEPFPEDERLTRDLEDIARRGFNTLRLYDPPSNAMLDTCERLGLRLMVGIPWTDHVDFFANANLQHEAIGRVTEIATRLGARNCLAAFIVGNEIEKTLVRWMGPDRVRAFLERLIDAGRAAAPGALFSYATYPSTEYLLPRNADFLAVNVYLETPRAFDAYLRRLQHLAGDKPLVISEFGLDVAGNDQASQAETMRWQRELCLKTGVAGSIWFSYTDEWFRGGEMVTGWHFGLVTADRTPRTAAEIHPSLPSRLGELKSGPRFSVVVCTRNGAATLNACLESLQHLRYSDYEVIVVDDGSTDTTPQIAQSFPFVRYLRQDPGGLSAARNVGAEAATGEIIAYTDDDCVIDEDWLLHLSHAFDSSEWVAAGGPNIPPPPRNATEAVVAAAPGAPMHVMLNDVEAEHLPGCNLAIRKSALREIGGFDPVFRAAGDDVDICWRLRETGGRLRFAPGAVVWHHRRNTVRAYFRQQRGYGHAEALLMKAHPKRFGPLGGAQWRGCIYGDGFATPTLREGTIHHGAQGNGLFQGVYSSDSGAVLAWVEGILWVSAALLLALAGIWWGALAVVLASLGVARWKQSRLPSPPFSLSARDRWLQGFLCWSQPVLRDWARIRGAITLGARPRGTTSVPSPGESAPEPPRKITLPLGTLSWWSADGRGRNDFLTNTQERLQSRGTWFRKDDGWRRFDVELDPHRDVSPALLTVTEYHRDGGRLTRVKLLARLTPKILWAYALLLILSAGIALMPFPLQHWIGMMAMGGLLTVPFMALLRARQRLSKLISRTASELGLEPCHSTR